MSVQFTLTSEEGLPIRGNLDVPADALALVVLVHGFKGFKDWGFFPWVAEYLTEHRFAVCRFNMSRSGIGENPETFDRLDLFAEDTFSTQLADLHTVVEYAQEQHRLSTFLLGHSRGGGVALLGAREISGLCGVITWNAIARVDRWDDAAKQKWREDKKLDVENARTKQVMAISTRALDDLPRHDILGASAKLEVPLLAIAGGDDETIPYAESKELTSAASEAVFVKIRTASHTLNAVHPFVTVPRQLELATAITCRFIAAYAE